MVPEVRTVPYRAYTALKTLGHDYLNIHHACFEVCGIGQVLDRLSSCEY